MPEHHHHDDTGLFNPETHHESTDVPIRPLWWAIGIFIVFGIVTHIVLGLFYKGLVIAERNRMDPPETAIARPADAGVPQNQPLLQPFPRTDDQGATMPPTAATPVSDMATMRAEEAKILDNYGWVDREHGIVHIPIDEAKSRMAALLAVEGQLGTASTPATATAAGAAEPTTDDAGGTTAEPAATATTGPAATATTGPAALSGTAGGTR